MKSDEETHMKTAVSLSSFHHRVLFDFFVSEKMCCSMNNCSNAISLLNKLTLMVQLFSHEFFHITSYVSSGKVLKTIA